jgi:pyruvate dehydrogenase E2 component (dihydrolipoamide acetyltransferase)
MPVEFTMPKLGLTMEEGTILSWLVDDGAAVTTGMPVMVIETDKTETEVEVNGSGVFHYAASIGDTLRCGEVIALLLADGEAMPVMSVPPPVSAPVSDIPPPPLPTTADIVDATAADRLVASPNARRIADELGVDLGTVRGTGPGGRITSEDVHDAAAMSIAEPAETAGATTSGVTGSPSAKLSSQLASRQLADLLGVDLRAIRADPTEGRVTRDGVAAHVRLRLAAANAPSGSGGTGGVGGGALLQTPSATVAMTGMRGTIAKRMHSSLRDMAQLTLTMDAAMDAVVVDRTKRRKRAEESDEPIPGYTDYVIAAVARALRAHPRVNSQVANDEIVVLPDIHVGLAVALDEGLLVPVVRHADRMALPDLADETSRLARAARARTLALADMEGGTFSVTALGMFGVDAFTPVVNPPNAAILGVGRLRDEVVARKGKVSTVKQLTLSLTWDHRVFDGAPAAEFTRTIVELLAEPGDLA